MASADGIRRNIATIPKEERDQFRNAIIALNKEFFYPGRRDDATVGGVSYWFKQDEIHQLSHYMEAQRSCLGTVSCATDLRYY